jgi:hypothetical protein
VQYNSPLATADACHRAATGVANCVVHLLVVALSEVCGLPLLMPPAIYNCHDKEPPQLPLRGVGSAAKTLHAFVVTL